MATIGRQSDTSLGSRIEQQYAGFNYYQLVRLLRQQAINQGENPESYVRFSADVGAAFAGREVTALEKTSRGITLNSPNYCVASVMGPLSEPYLEWMRDRSRDGDTVMADFLNLFNNRLHQLRFKIKQQRFPGLHTGVPADSVQAGFLRAVMGLVDNPAIQHVPLDQRKLLAIAGLLVNQRRSAPLLERILANLLGIPVKITQMIGAWCEKDEADVSYLGQKNTALGSRASLGRRVWDQQARIRVEMGPLDFSAYLALLPGQAGHEDLAQVLRYVINRNADCEVVLTTEKTRLPLQSLAETKQLLDRYLVLLAVPYRDQRLYLLKSWRVSTEQGLLMGQQGFRLGQTAWLSEGEYSAQPRQTRFVISAFETADQQGGEVL